MARHQWQRKNRLVFDPVVNAHAARAYDRFDFVILDRQRVQFLFAGDETKPRRTIELEIERSIAALADQLQPSIEMQVCGRITVVVDQAGNFVAQRCLAPS